MKKKIKQTKIRSDKQVKKIAERYKKNLDKGAEKASKDLDKLLKDLEQYYGKRGKLLKSKIRSEKAKQRYNQILEDIKQLGSAPKRANKSKEVQKSETSDKLQKYFGMTGEHAAAAAEIFVNRTMPIAARGYKPSQVVLTLAEAGFDSDSIQKVLDYIERDLEWSTPDEMRLFREEDDIYMFVSHMASIYELDPRIPTDDVIKLADTMLTYDFDNYEAVIEEYWKHTDSIWDDWNKDEDDEDEE